MADEIGGITGIVSGGATYSVTGALFKDSNTGMTFNSTDATINCGENYQFSGTANFSIEFWMRISSYPGYYPYLIGRTKDVGFGGYAFYWHQANNRLEFARANADGSVTDRTNGTAGIALNTWHHYVGTYDGSDLRLYENGVLKTTTPATLSVGVFSAGWPFRISGELNTSSVLGACFAGSLDEVAVYNVPVSGDDILNHYEAGKKTLFANDKVLVKETKEFTLDSPFNKAYSEVIKLKESKIINIGFSKDKLDILKLKENKIIHRNINVPHNDIVYILDTFNLYKTKFVSTQEIIKLLETVTENKINPYASVVSEVDIYSWNPREIEPIGYRHVPSGSPAFEQVVSETGYLDIGKFEYGVVTSPSKCITIRPRNKSPRTTITNLRLWRNSVSGLGTWGTDISVNMLVTDNWALGAAVQSGAGIIVPTSLPVNQNIYRMDGETFIDSGSNDPYFEETEENISQYVFLSLNMKPSSFPNGFYGSVGTGDLQMRLTYDYAIGTRNE